MNFMGGDEDSILTSRFDPQKKTKILAHGFTFNGMDDFVTGTTEAYLGTIHKGRPQNFWDVSPPRFLCPHFCQICSSKITQPPLLRLLLGQLPFPLCF